MCDSRGGRGHIYISHNEYVTFQIKVFELEFECILLV